MSHQNIQPDLMIKYRLLVKGLWSVRFFFHELILLFTEGALNLSKVTVKTCNML